MNYIMIIIIVIIIITNVGDSAFYSNSALTLVVLTPGLTIIGFQMFIMGQQGGDSSLQTLTIPSTVTTYGEKCRC